MAYFYPNLDTKLNLDGSPAGLESILTQLYTIKEGSKYAHIMAYASKSLAEKKLESCKLVHQLR